MKFKYWEPGSWYSFNDMLLSAADIAIYHRHCSIFFFTWDMYCLKFKQSNNFDHLYMKLFKLAISLLIYQKIWTNWVIMLVRTHWFVAGTCLTSIIYSTMLVFLLGGSALYVFMCWYSYGKVFLVSWRILDLLLKYYLDLPNISFSWKWYF